MHVAPVPSSRGRIFWPKTKDVQCHFSSDSFALLRCVSPSPVQWTESTTFFFFCLIIVCLLASGEKWQDNTVCNLYENVNFVNDDNRATCYATKKWSEETIVFNRNMVEEIWQSIHSGGANIKSRMNARVCWPITVGKWLWHIRQFWSRHFFYFFANTLSVSDNANKRRNERPVKQQYRTRLAALCTKSSRTWPDTNDCDEEQGTSAWLDKYETIFQVWRLWVGKNQPATLTCHTIIKI